MDLCYVGIATWLNPYWGGLAKYGGVGAGIVGSLGTTDAAGVDRAWAAVDLREQQGQLIRHRLIGTCRIRWYSLLLRPDARKGRGLPRVWACRRIHAAGASERVLGPFLCLARFWRA